jgi:N6-adenosine-specific RNA methylase IME4
MLEQAFDLMRAWGFVYKTGGAWFKTTSGGKLAFGTGYRLRNACEPFLLGFRGSPKNSRSHRNVLTGAVREHSRKPDEIYPWCESYVPGPKCELFSRTSREGWATWGDETGLFTQNEEMSIGETI